MTLDEDAFTSAKMIPSVYEIGSPLLAPMIQPLITFITLAFRVILVKHHQQKNDLIKLIQEVLVDVSIYQVLALKEALQTQLEPQEEQGIVLS